MSPWACFHGKIGLAKSRCASEQNYRSHKSVLPSSVFSSTFGLFFSRGKTTTLEGKVCLLFVLRSDKQHDDSIQFPCSAWPWSHPFAVGHGAGARSVRSESLEMLLKEVMSPLGEIHVHVGCSLCSFWHSLLAALSSLRYHRRRKELCNTPSRSSTAHPEA